MHYRAWGPAGSGVGIVLLHGGAAHSGWWDHVAPLLGPGRVIAPDLSGHGDSAHVGDYDGSHWVAEVRAVGRAEGLTRPVLVGHSMGGWVAVGTAVTFADWVRSVVVVDSPLLTAVPEHVPPARTGTLRVYPTVEQAVARFRTQPRQEVLLPYVAAHVAAQSLRRVPGGWSWKFDPALWARRPLHANLLPRLQRPMAMVRSEHGLVGPDMVREMAGQLAQRLVDVELPEAGHHAMFDQPLPLVAALRALLAAWA